MKEIHKKILVFVKQYMLDHDYPPTTREIGDGVGYTSSSTIWGYLRDMKEIGLIDYVDECPRTITIPGMHYTCDTKDNIQARGTKENYLNAIRRLLTEISTKSLDQMDTTDIDWYLSRYEIRNVSSGGKKNQPSTYNNERRFLSAFFTWMRLEKLITDNPVESIPAKKVPVKPIDYYSPEESARLRDACKNIRERALLEVLRSTGARIGEIAEIALDQVDMRTGDICIQGEKSGKYRTIYLDDDARHYYSLYLDSRKDDCLYMFPRSRKPYGKMTTCGFRAILKTIRKRAGLTCRVYPRKSRKTLGMNLKNRGVDIGTIQEIMGHADPGVTARYYAQSNPRTLRSVRERVNV